MELVEREVARLRGELVIARTDAGAARVLAAGADHDVAEVRAELRAHTQALNALRETQLEHQEETRTGFATVNAGIAQIVRLIGGISGAGNDDQ